ncbi:(2Fe-2S)-binding protein [Lederbergia sp. NSJ-179]|uniref:(2Fe-2S)-binding protein n=1 Tax=Lederbergia sp. NSJ-179 TaxID=2931402 RepID=UPI001FD0B8D4|nr:(2Fe-2S)-binding protein [Lederbergia sp. NSJ-179]MCJ7842385.1 (2Fe-2S)-binding protein [Lederbergia sp. NSJ-179]
MTNRILDHPVLGKIDGEPKISFRFNHQILTARSGETLAAALLANGIRRLREHEESGAPRGIYCNIGHCYECRLTVDGKTGVRACLTLVKEGMIAESIEKLPTPLKNRGIYHE